MALSDYWRKVAPPVHLLVRDFAGWKPQQAQDITDIFPELASLNSLDDPEG